MLFVDVTMIDTFYLHLEFSNKKYKWSINLPFLCTKCGVCCLLEDFLTAGEISAKPEEQPEVHGKIETLFEEIGKMWEAEEAEYDDFIAHTPCPFLVNNSCSIYEIRPVGCRLFPKTTFGMQTQDCPPLTRFKKQRSALIKGRTHKETYQFTYSAKSDEAIKTVKFIEKQYQTCIARLRQAGVTEDELNLFNYFNVKNKK
jgi:Fe-S-cluster containining protein